MAFYKQDIVDINLNTGSIFRSFLNHSIGFKNDDADRFGIRCFRDGEPVDLSGASCQAVFMAPNGVNIALTSYGTVSGNVAYVTLPPACYDYEGQFCLSIQLVGGGVTGTMRIVDGMVLNTGASGAIAPTASVPTYQEIIAQYDAMVAATSAANLAIAETFDATKAYPAGKYVINEGHLYRLTADHAANVTWANTSKVATNFGDDLSSLKSALDNFNGQQFEWTLGGFINATSGDSQFGQIVNDSVYLYSNIINVIPNSMVHIRTKALGSAGIVFYSMEGTPVLGIKPAGVYDSDVSVPENAYTMRASLRQGYENGDFYIVADKTISTLSNNIKNLTKTHLNKYIDFDEFNFASDDFVDFDVEMGSIEYATGVPSYANDVVRTTDYIKKDGTYIIRNTNSPASMWIAIEYDDSGNYVGWTQSWNTNAVSEFVFNAAHKYKFIFRVSNGYITINKALETFFIYKKSYTKFKNKVSASNDFLLFNEWRNNGTNRALSNFVSGDNNYIRIQYDSDISICFIIYKDGQTYIQADWNKIIPQNFSFFLEKGKSYQLFAKYNDDHTFDAIELSSKVKCYRSEKINSIVDFYNYWVNQNSEKNDKEISFTRLATTSRIIGTNGKTLLIYNPQNLVTLIDTFDENGDREGEFVWGSSENCVSIETKTGYTYDIYLRRNDNSNIDAANSGVSIYLINTVPSNTRNNKNVLSIAHQGYSVTGDITGRSKIESFYGAYYMGFDYGETDIKWSSDNVPVCCHDASFVDQNTGNVIVISEHTAAELKTYKYYGGTIATFDEVLGTCKKLGLGLVIDHVSASFTDAQLLILRQIVQKYQMQRNVIWSVEASGTLIDSILAWDESASIGLSTSDKTQFQTFVNLIIEKANGKSKFYIGLLYSNVSISELEQYNLDIPPYVEMTIWTIDDIDAFKEYLPFVTAIYSNKIACNMISY